MESLKPAICTIVSLKKLAYPQYELELHEIIQNKITATERIEALFDNLLSYYDDEDFMKLFWRLIQYVESFDDGIGSFYRRQEELLNEGV